MTVKWEYFAKRRNIDIKSFQDHLSYEQYTKWCKQRNVEPVTADVYGVKKIQDICDDEHIVPDIDWTKLLKSRKSDIVELCIQHDVEFESSDTKKILVKKLKDALL